MSRYPFGRALLSFALFFGLAGTALAGSLTVNPLRVTLTGTNTLGEITVRNDGDDITLMQLEASSWAQKDGVTVLNPTTEILVTPLNFTLQPGGSQTVRIALRRPVDSERELTYRVYLRAAPQGKPPSHGLRASSRVTVPVFVTPQSVSAPKLEWRVVQMPDGKIHVSAKNVGNAHVQVGNFTLSLVDGGKLIASQQAAEYVLPGNSRAWRVKSDVLLSPGAQVRILAHTDAGEMPTQVALEHEAIQIAPDTQAMAY